MKKKNKVLLYLLIVTGYILIYTNSCKKDEIPAVQIPVLTTLTVSDITQTSYTSGGSIISLGGAMVTARGVCWGTNKTPTIANSKTTDGTGEGSYTSDVTGLSPNTTYYIRAYATNIAGTGYGSVLSFKTLAIQIPVLTTSVVSSITFTTATCGGNIISDGGSTYMIRGVCWRTDTTPTIADSKTNDGSDTGSFISSITGLFPNTIYYVRAYATNSEGTGYGNTILFTTLSGGDGGTVTDIDGNVYHTITIGTQVWMFEDLKTTRFRNGDPIPTYYAYSDVYSWYAVNDSRNIAPSGWHIPTDKEWYVLTTYLGGEDIAGGKLKEAGTLHWNSPNTGATNESGFTALPGDYIVTYGSNTYTGFYSFWWSSTDTIGGSWSREMFYTNSTLYRTVADKSYFYFVRCIKDN